MFSEKVIKEVINGCKGERRVFRLSLSFYEEVDLKKN